MIEEKRIGRNSRYKLGQATFSVVILDIQQVLNGQ